ncbi:MAG: serine/threonine-protein kinase [Gemmatimonadota bacterium]
MNAADWAQLKDWFGAALDTPEDIDGIMAEAERRSPELAEELRSLLREHAAPLLDTKAVRVHAASTSGPLLDTPVGGEVGPYRIIRELGRGGSGIVFLAERRDDQFHRQVALKVLRYVSWDRRTQELLTGERAVLSQLQHANIAALIDWSTAADSTPWLAMEFVDGMPIDRYCHTHGLDVSQTLDVFEQVCEAVQYAHRHLVVHRDLKPGNIIVTHAGVAKLLDFGISKRVEDATVTSTGLRQFTPAYASPEQIKGEPITAATDVYALGLILYELLAGTVPHASGTVEDLLRRTQDRPVTAPSARATLPSISRVAIHGDLDRIVLHALEPDPESRYPSVERLLADIQRFRSGHPIEARPPSRVYLAQKFVQRNVLALSLALVATVALIVGAGVAVWNAREARRAQVVAEKRFEEVRTLAHWVIFDAHDAIRRIPGTVAVRRDLLAKAVEYLDQLSAEHGADDALRKEIAQAYIRVGYSQGGLAGTNLGNTAASMKNYRAALNILDSLWLIHPTDEWIGAARFAAVYNLSMMISNPADGAEFARRYATEVDAWVRRNTASPPLQAAELVHMGLGRALRAMGQFDSALEQFDVALAADRKALPLSRTDNAPRPMFGTWLDRSQNLFDTGLAEFARTETLLDIGRVDDAIANAEKARALFAQSKGEGLGGPSDQRMFARVHGLVARALWASHRPALIDKALAAASIEFTAATANVADGNATSVRDLAEAHQHLGNILVARGDLQDGIEHLRSAIAGMDGLVTSDSVFLVNRVLLAGMLNDFGAASVAAKQDAAADAAYRRAFGLMLEAGKGAPTSFDVKRERSRAEGHVPGTATKLQSRDGLPRNDIAATSYGHY